jgi:hypothetical protein
MEHKLERIAIEHYNLGSKFCRENLKEGGEFVNESLNFTNISV